MDAHAGRSQVIGGGTKPHFAVLDGLRGVAALCVVIFHFSEMVIWDYGKLWIGHGFLAVDFFFCLSGFVLGYAYNDRIAEVGLGRFLKARLVRLQPMVIFGAVLGLVAFYANPFGKALGYSGSRVALLFVASILLIPFGGMRERSQNLFGLNAPAWSLFWEYVASLVFGLVLYRIRRGTLIVVTIAAAVALCWAGHRAGNLSGGWSARNFWDGGARVAFSFSAGLLVYRLGWKLRTRLGFVVLSLLLFLAFVMPYTTGAWVREAMVIIVGFPLLVALGAGATVSPRMERLCRFSGDLSYPLYMTHYGVMWIWGDYAGAHHLASASLWTAVALGVSIMLAFGWAVLRLVDEPVRRSLTSKTVPRDRDRQLVRSRTVGS